MAKVYRLAQGNGYAERVFVTGQHPSSRCTWLWTTTITAISRREMAHRLREHRAAGLPLEVIGETPRADGLEHPTDTREPWIERPGFPTQETLTLRSGTYKIEYLRCESKHGWQGTTYRYTWAVTFVSEDGRRVQFTALDSRTRGEIIGSARLHEGWGAATVTYPRRLARPKWRDVTVGSTSNV